MGHLTVTFFVILVILACTCNVLRSDDKMKCYIGNDMHRYLITCIGSSVSCYWKISRGNNVEFGCIFSYHKDGCTRFPRKVLTCYCNTDFCNKIKTKRKYATSKMKIKKNL